MARFLRCRVCQGPRFSEGTHKGWKPRRRNIEASGGLPISRLIASGLISTRSWPISMGRKRGPLNALTRFARGLPIVRVNLKRHRVPAVSPRLLVS
jgi:hypothetical protein